MRLETKIPLPAPDYLAPDGSETRFLANMNGGGLCHCALPSGRTSLAVPHKIVEESWYFTEECHGGVWRKLGDEDQEVDVQPALSPRSTAGTYFQLCNTGQEPVSFVMAMMAPWPGKDEAGAIPNHGQTNSTTVSEEIDLKTRTTINKSTNGRKTEMSTCTTTSTWDRSNGSYPAIHQNRHVLAAEEDQ